jgi:hypothetical protein
MPPPCPGKVEAFLGPSTLCSYVLKGESSGNERTPQLLRAPPANRVCLRLGQTNLIARGESTSTQGKPVKSLLWASDT